MAALKSALVLLMAVGVVYVRLWMQPVVPTNAGGFCVPRFAKVEDAFRQNLESGAERGGAFAVYHKGELVCDLWGGFADEYIEYPWQENTLSIFFSTTKAACAFCLMLLADRGLLDYNKPVAHYWPEFAQNGKENITVKMLVGHQAGLVAMDNETYHPFLMGMSSDDVGRILAAQKPHWPPGSGHGYHIFTFGPYVDQLVRRVDPKHRGIGQFFRDEIGSPFGIDFFIGLPKEEHYRAAHFMEMSLLEVATIRCMNLKCIQTAMCMATEPVSRKAFHTEHLSQMSRYAQFSPEYKQFAHGSTNGYGTARGLAKLFGILTNGGKLGDRVLLSPAILPKLDEAVISGIDRVLGFNMTRGHGVDLFVKHPEAVKQRGTSHMTFGACGYGGQVGLGDTAHRLGWAYLTNYPTTSLGNSAKYEHLHKALYECLRDAERPK